MHLHSIAPGISLLFALTLLTACGGGGGGSSPQSAPSPAVTVLAEFSLDIDRDNPGAIIFDGSASRVEGTTTAASTLVSYRWQFGDGETASGEVVSHSYAVPGPYRATLTVTDSFGNSDSTSARTTFDISGTVFAASSSAVDIDVNDTGRQNSATLGPDFQRNNDFPEAQVIPNPALLNGFVSNSPASSASENGNFFASTDSEDFYSVYLIEGQFVSLRVSDYDEAIPFLNDIDLELYDSDLNLVAFSDSATEFESLSVDIEGQYYIRVIAFAGISKYVLNIGNSSFVNGIRAFGSPAGFIPGEAIFKVHQNRKAAGEAAIAAATVVNPTAQANSRAALMRFEVTPLSVAAATAGGDAVQYSPARMAMAGKNHDAQQTLRHIKQMRKRSDMEYVEPNYRVKPLLLPNDSLYPLQWHYSQINLPQAWDITTGTPATGSVIVAVVDTGVVLDHEDLRGQLVPGYDFIRDPVRSNDGDGIDDDPNDPGDGVGLAFSSWHGSHVAGTVAASSDNGLGTAGVSWGARIMPVRVLGQNGGSSYDVIQGIRYAAGLSNDSGTVPAQAADIINLSLGGGGFSAATQDLFDQIRELGIIVVAAAGNESSSSPAYPASYAGVISVSAVGFDKNLAPYSNSGAFIDVAAPGGDARTDRNGDGYGDGVLSTVVDESVGRDGYAFYQGTSMAAPHVAGVAALMKAVYPDLDGDDFDASLQNGLLSRDLGAPGRDNFFGYGLIDAPRSVQQAQVLAGGTEVGSMLLTPSQLDFGANLDSLTVTLTPFGSAPPTVDAIVNTVSWLNIDSSAAQADGSGDYIFRVDRTDLADATYSDVVLFELSNGSTLTLPVFMQVQTGTSFDADVGYLYILVLNPETYESVAQFAVDVRDGQYPFQFRNIPFGEYVIFAGSDIDGDFFICDGGESCGNYPTNEQALRLFLDEDVEDIDFLASIVVEIVGASSSEGSQGRRPVARTPEG